MRYVENQAAKIRGMMVSGVRLVQVEQTAGPALEVTTPKK